jgi:DNA-binding ferritin-like protein (Dps family)
VVLGGSGGSAVGEEATGPHLLFGRHRTDELAHRLVAAIDDLELVTSSIVDAAGIERLLDGSGARTDVTVDGHLDRWDLPMIDQVRRYLAQRYTVPLSALTTPWSNIIHLSFGRLPHLFEVLHEPRRIRIAALVVQDIAPSDELDLALHRLNPGDGLVRFRHHWNTVLAEVVLPAPTFMGQHLDVALDSITSPDVLRATDAIVKDFGGEASFRKRYRPQLSDIVDPGFRHPTTRPIRPRPIRPIDDPKEEHHDEPLRLLGGTHHHRRRRPRRGAPVPSRGAARGRRLPPQHLHRRAHRRARRVRPARQRRVGAPRQPGDRRVAERPVEHRHPPQPAEPLSAPELEGRPVVDHARIAQAAAYAVTAHAGQTRKGTSVHYASHVLAVGALVIEHGGTTEQVIAGFLHDVVEDCGGAARLAEVRRVFGDEVAELVDAVSDAAPAPGEQKAPWRLRKEEYLAHLADLVGLGSAAVLVSACDRLHNLTAIGEDLDDPAIGTDVFTRFNARSTT